MMISVRERERDQHSGSDGRWSRPVLSTPAE